MTERPLPQETRDDTAKKEDSVVPKLSDLVPGDVIEFADIRELTAFEDLIAAEVDPKHKPEVWAARAKLRDLIRPPDFNGTIADIKLVVMADPYERLLDAKDRGLKPGSGNHVLSSELVESQKANYRGFILTATPISSRPGNLGQIQAELWYFPVPPSLEKAGKTRHGSYKLKSGEVIGYTATSRNDYIKRKNHQEGKAINRVVTQPRIERELFIQAHETSRRIGFDVLRQAMMQLISTPMRD